MSQRDRRFVAQHRGGPLSSRHHRMLATWAAECAEHVMPARPDKRVRRALAVIREWVRGEASTGECMKAAVAAHAAARAARSKAATFASRAAGHAVATAHAADHSLGPVIYGVKAVEAKGGDADAERAWQMKKLPPVLRRLVKSALIAKGAATRPRVGARSPRR